MPWGFFGNLIFAIIARMLCGIILIIVSLNQILNLFDHKQYIYFFSVMIWSPCWTLCFTPPPQSSPPPWIDHGKFDPGHLKKWLGLLTFEVRTKGSIKISLSNSLGNIWYIIIIFNEMLAGYQFCPVVLVLPINYYNLFQYTAW